MKQYLLFPLALILSSCGWQKGDGHFSVVLSPDFTEDQAAEVESSLAIWTEKTSGVVNFTVGGEDPNLENTIWIYPSTYRGLTEEHPTGEEWHWTTGYTTYEGTSSIIQVSVDLNHPEFQETMLHELGHALGLAHDIRGTIMFADGYGEAKSVTCRDLKQFCTIWLCDYKKLEGCRK